MLCFAPRRPSLDTKCVLFHLERNLNIFGCRTDCQVPESVGVLFRNKDGRSGPFFFSSEARRACLIPIQFEIETRVGSCENGPVLPHLTRWEPSQEMRTESVVSVHYVGVAVPYLGLLPGE